MVRPRSRAAAKGDEQQDTPIYTIGTVCRETGLHPATVRTWEDRYHRIVPIRDVGGRRLYSRRQIEDLRWLSDQVDSGLQPSEAHRLLDDRLRSSTGHVPSLSQLAGAEGAAAAFGRWVDTDRETLLEKLWMVKERVAALSADLVLNYAHPVYGLTRSTVVQATDSARSDDVNLARFVAVSWSELPDTRSALAEGNSVQLRFSEMDDLALGLFEATDIRSVLMSPLIVDDIWCGLLEVTSGEDRSWDAAAVSVVERAAGLLVSMFEAHTAESDFSDLLGDS